MAHHGCRTAALILGFCCTILKRFQVLLKGLGVIITRGLLSTVKLGIRYIGEEKYRQKGGGGRERGGGVVAERESE